MRAGTDLPRERRRSRGLRPRDAPRLRVPPGRSRRTSWSTSSATARYGHNEADEPAFTQPRMYELIRARRSVRKLYTETARQPGRHHPRRGRSRRVERLPGPPRTARSRRRTAGPAAEPASKPIRHRARRRSAAPPARDRGAGRPARHGWSDGAHARGPTGSRCTPKLARHARWRTRTDVRGTARVDWALAEALAFGSLVLDGTPVRLAGQDTRRGTFSQRHGVLVDVETEAEYVPLDDRRRRPGAVHALRHGAVASTRRWASSTATRSPTPTRWCAGRPSSATSPTARQMIVDQFVVAARGQVGRSAAASSLLLPHGFEGQGPEHSSARIERFLALCAEDNLRVVYPTTAAQYFHVLRRQSPFRPRRCRSSCFTPKRYLRMPADALPVASSIDGALRARARRPRRAPDRRGAPGDALHREDRPRADGPPRRRRGAPAAVVRVEQLYPWPEPSSFAIARPVPGREAGVVGPGGAGEHGCVVLRPRHLHRVLRDRAKLQHVARPPTRARRAGAPRCTTPSSTRCWPRRSTSSR